MKSIPLLSVGCIAIISDHIADNSVLEKIPFQNVLMYQTVWETKSKTWLQKGLLLSAAVSPSKKVMDAGYDIPSIARDLDWIAVMTYDYHGHWDKKTGHVSPMYAHPEDDYDYFNTVSFVVFS